MVSDKCHRRLRCYTLTLLMLRASRYNHMNDYGIHIQFLVKRLNKPTNRCRWLIVVCNNKIIPHVKPEIRMVLLVLSRRIPWPPELWANLSSLWTITSTDPSKNLIMQRLLACGMKLISAAACDIFRMWYPVVNFHLQLAVADILTVSLGGKWIDTTSH